MDGDDYTYDTKQPLAQRAAVAQAHLEQDLARIETQTFDQRALAFMARLEAAMERQQAAINANAGTIHKQGEEIEHMKLCIHKLMNPQEGDDGDI